MHEETRCCTRCRLRNDPNEPQALSGLSCYIHFGQLGMQRAALRCIEVKSKYRVRSLAS